MKWNWSQSPKQKESQRLNKNHIRNEASICGKPTGKQTRDRAQWWTEFASKNTKKTSMHDEKLTCLVFPSTISCTMIGGDDPPPSVFANLGTEALDKANARICSGNMDCAWQDGGKNEWYRDLLFCFRLVSLAEILKTVRRRRMRRCQVRHTTARARLS